MDKPEEVNKNLNIELSEEIAEGVYANLAMIAHSSSEFVIDYIRLMPGVPKAKVKARIGNRQSMQKDFYMRWKKISKSMKRLLEKLKRMSSHLSSQLILEAQ